MTAFDMATAGPSWDLRQGNCVEPLTGLGGLAALSVDVTITDPPYDEHTHTAQRVGRMRNERGDYCRTRSLGFEHLEPRLRRLVACELARVTRRWVLVFSDLESHHLWSRDLARAGLEHVRVGIWHKLGATPQFTGDRPASAAEAIVIAHRPGRKFWNGGGRHASWTCPIVNGKRRHTTEKPLSLMERLIRDFTLPGELVLDPFAGSGTTGAAAVRLGRNFIGWERSPIYADWARRRLAATHEQLELCFASGS